MQEMIAEEILERESSGAKCLQLRETLRVQLMDTNHMLNWSDMMAPLFEADLNIKCHIST